MKGKEENFNQKEKKTDPKESSPPKIDGMPSVQLKKENIQSPAQEIPKLYQEDKRKDQEHQMLPANVETTILATIGLIEKLSLVNAPKSEVKLKLGEVSKKLKECQGERDSKDELNITAESEVKEICKNLDNLCNTYNITKIKFLCEESIIRRMNEQITNIDQILLSLNLYLEFKKNGNRENPRIGIRNEENKDIRGSPEFIAQIESMKNEIRKLQQRVSQLTDQKAIEEKRFEKIQSQNIADKKYQAPAVPERSARKIDKIEKVEENQGQAIAREQKQSLEIPSKENEEEKKLEKLPKMERLFILGERAYFAEGKDRNIEEAFKYYSEAAELGNGEAYARLGKIYETGDGKEKNMDKAYQMYYDGAAKGDPPIKNPRCLYELGLLHETKRLPKGVPSKGTKEALEIYEAASKAGCPEADTRIGTLFDKGLIGASADPERAMDYYRRGAGKGDALAYSYMGLYYYNRKEDPKAVENFKISRSLGCPEGCNNLGKCYENGNGVPKNTEEALKLYKEAAEMDYSPAMLNIGLLYLERSTTAPNSDAETNDSAFAVEWFKSCVHIDPNNDEALYYLGYLFQNGKGCKQSNKLAFDYYSKASNAGNIKATKKLADMLLEHGEKSKAVEKYKEAAKSGDMESNYILGSIYEHGEHGVKKDEEVAAGYYGAAYQGGNREAGRCQAMIMIRSKKNTEAGLRKMKELADSGDKEAKEFLVKYNSMRPPPIEIKKEAIIPKTEQEKDDEDIEAEVVQEENKKLPPPKAKPSPAKALEQIPEESSPAEAGSKIKQEISKENASAAPQTISEMRMLKKAGTIAVSKPENEYKFKLPVRATKIIKEEKKATTSETVKPADNAINRKYGAGSLAKKYDKEDDKDFEGL